MAPRTRKSVQRLATINAEYDNEYQDASGAKESKNSNSQNDEGQVSADDSETRSTTATKPISGRGKRTVDFGDPRVAFGPKSKLTKVDLSKFLSDEKTWASLTNEQQAILKAMCPKDSAWGKSTLEQPTLGFLLYDMHWKSDVRTYTENMSNGHYHPAWIEEAEKATSKRGDGEFDDWKLKNFEAYWGQKMDSNAKEPVDKKQTVALSDLFGHGQLQIGDEWSYSKSFGRGKKLITIEHKFHMASIDDYGRAHFRICLPARTTTLKRCPVDMEDEDRNEDGCIPERIKSGKQVKIMVVDNDQLQQNAQANTLLTTPPRLQDDTTDASLDALKTDTIETSDLTSQTAIAEEQFTELVLHNNGDRTTTQPPKSILKKPSMAMFSIIAAEVENLEKQLLSHSGHDQDTGKTDCWKHFTIRRGDQDIGTLKNLRDEFRGKLG